MENQLIEKLRQYLDRVYVKNIDIACLELPILKILSKNENWINRDKIINELKSYGNFKRGELSFDHLWSQRFGKGEESELLNQLVEHDGENPGDKKTQYRIKENMVKELASFLKDYNQDIQSLILKRLISVGEHNEKFKDVCLCLNKSIENSNGKLSLKTIRGTNVYLEKQQNDNYKITFDGEKSSSESITLNNLYLFLYEEWRGKVDLGRDDSRLTLFDAIKKYIENNCKNKKENLAENKDSSMICKNNSKKIAKLQSSEEFYFKKLQEIFRKYQQYQIEKDTLEDLIQNIENMSSFNFQTFLDTNSKYSDFLLLIGQIISMCDINGYNKKLWNPYEDKRTLAKAGVRQNDWTKQLLSYKINNNISDLPSSIANAIKFINAPEKNLTQLSNNHRKLTSDRLLNTDYDELTYFDNLKEYFNEEIKKYPLKYKQNIGLLISFFLYCDEIKDIWMKNPQDAKITNSNGDSDLSTYPLNQILYGPPGTGKTYNTINKALEIIFEKEKGETVIVHVYQKHQIKKSISDLKKILNLKNPTEEERKDLKTVFDFYGDQIEFVTFHQSYGYEEFVEGIKAIPAGEEGNEAGKEMVYKVVNGIFKKISQKSEENYLNSQKSDKDIQKEQKFKNLLEDFLNDVIENSVRFQKKQGGKFTVEGVEGDKISVYSEDSKFNDYLLELDFNELLKITKSEENFNTSKELAKKVFNIENQRQKDTYYLSLYKEIKKKHNNINTNIVVDKKLKNYILIIDEINRGNISKIFGELITLIEDSKRIGTDEALEITLPYSNTKFGVSQNLYIIGTMNTADRSIAPIDTALRRRFVFVEMQPKPNKLKTTLDDADINLQSILKAINVRIEYLYDRDHTIGHTYLLNVNTLSDLKFAFKNKILPLLAEYFYENWENIDLVLNGNEFIIKDVTGNQYLSKITNKISSKNIYKIRNSDHWKVEHFKKIYNDKVIIDEKNTPTDY